MTLDRQTGDATFTLRDLSQRVVREVTLHGDGRWSWDADFVSGGGRLLVEDGPKGVRHVHLGLGGNTRLTTDADGYPVEWLDLEPFGDRGSLTERMQFAGSEREIGDPGATTDDLDFMHARRYNMHLSRFLTPDPVCGDPMIPQSCNPYAYARNNPLRFTDPWGLNEKDTDGKTGGCDQDGAGGDRECEMKEELLELAVHGLTIPLRVSRARWWFVKHETLLYLRYLRGGNMKITVNLAGSGFGKFFGIKGLTYYSLDFTNMDKGEFSLDFQPMILGAGVDFEQHGLQMPRLNSFHLKFAVFDKTLWDSGGWDWLNGETSASIGGAYLFGAAFTFYNLNSLFVESYTIGLEAARYSIFGGRLGFEGGM